jgi:hypothetical protein
VIICQDELEWFGCKIDEGIGFIVTDRVVDHEQPEDQSDEGNDPKDYIYEAGVFLVNE